MALEILLMCINLVISVKYWGLVGVSRWDLRVMIIWVSPVLNHIDITAILLRFGRFLHGTINPNWIEKQNNLKSSYPTSCKCVSVMKIRIFWTNKVRAHVVCSSKYWPTILMLHCCYQMLVLYCPSLYRLGEIDEDVTFFDRVGYLIDNIFVLDTIWAYIHASTFIPG